MTLIYDCSKGRCEAATQPCGRGEIDRLGNSNEIYVSEVDGDELSERAPTSEPRLKLGTSDLLLAFRAFLTPVSTNYGGVSCCLPGLDNAFLLIGAERQLRGERREG
jgi:hypothetical protein